MTPVYDVVIQVPRIDGWTVHIIPPETITCDSAHDYILTATFSYMISYVRDRVTSEKMTIRKVYVMTEFANGSIVPFKQEPRELLHGMYIIDDLFDDEAMSMLRLTYDC
jgi:hypothetical protein